MMKCHLAKWQVLQFNPTSRLGGLRTFIVDVSVSAHFLYYQPHTAQFAAIPPAQRRFLWYCSSLKWFLKKRKEKKKTPTNSYLPLPPNVALLLRPLPSLNTTSRRWKADITSGWATFHCSKNRERSAGWLTLPLIALHVWERQMDKWGALALFGHTGSKSHRGHVAVYQLCRHKHNTWLVITQQQIDCTLQDVLGTVCFTPGWTKYLTIKVYTVQNEMRTIMNFHFT